MPPSIKKVPIHATGMATTGMSVCRVCVCVCATHMNVDEIQL
jgi:hypothetical protein